MATHIEKLQFSERLQHCLLEAGISAASPTALARKFNVLSPDAGVSPQAVRRWLEGTSIPSQDKLVVLARWLKVSPEWLRFGDASRSPANTPDNAREHPAEYDARTLATMIELLSEENREAVSRIISALLDGEGKTVSQAKKRH
ncbi:MAG: helix-turn-helix domain-containing protein [Alcanivoracaceae bacterium]|jgi:transcriptional regulator with XRE-family HTH domain|nr:helix-turn-helix domain-containing protein [Alcanivoracaceae bacterium]